MAHEKEEVLNFEYFLTKKVAASGSKSFSRLIVRIAIFTTALSMAVMIVASSLITGFENEISSKIFGFWGHILITDASVNHSSETVPIDKKQDFYPSLDTIQKIKYADVSDLMDYDGDEPIVANKETKGGIRHIQIYALKPGIIKVKNRVEPIALKGVWKDFDWDFLKHYLIKGRVLELNDSVPSKDILISQQTANRMMVDVGDQFIIIFIKDNNEFKRRFKVCGIYRTGLEEYDKRFALVDIRKVQQLYGWSENLVSGFEVFVDDLDDLKPIADYIYMEKIPRDLYAETIREKYPNIFEWLKFNKINGVVIISLMIVVSIINMVTALMILILERTQMIGTLKALGSTNWSIRKIFLYYATYIIILGLFWGNLIGLTLCWLQQHFGFVKLSEEDYYLSVAPIEINFQTVMMLNIGTLVITVLFLIIPSFLVSRISPVKAIRFN